MEWNYDITQAPKGHLESRKSPKGDGYYDEYVHDHIIIATKCGKVTRSYWVPKESRWCMMSKNEEPEAWIAWPVHPSKAKGE